MMSANVSNLQQVDFAKLIQDSEENVLELNLEDYFSLDEWEQTIDDLENFAEQNATAAAQISIEAQVPIDCTKDLADFSDTTISEEDFKLCFEFGESDFIEGESLIRDIDPIELNIVTQNEDKLDYLFSEEPAEASGTIKTAMPEPQTHTNDFQLHLPPGGKIVVAPIDEVKSQTAAVYEPKLTANPASIYTEPELSYPQTISFSEITKRRASEPAISTTKRKFSTASPSSLPENPPKKARFEESLLQNLPGLCSVRSANGFNEYSDFSSVSNGFNYIYEPAMRAHMNCYEPAVIRKDLDRPQDGPAGLCPYCPSAKFLALNTSAYLHHLTVNHGVFSNGTEAKEPEVCVQEVLTNSGKKEKMEFFICPYDCELKQIKMVKLNKKRPAVNRYKVYLRHVKDCHCSGKRDDQLKSKDECIF